MNITRQNKQTETIQTETTKEKVFNLLLLLLFFIIVLTAPFIDTFLS